VLVVLVSYVVGGGHGQVHVVDHWHDEMEATISSLHDKGN
jgi:hypothetical protein